MRTKLLFLSLVTAAACRSGDANPDRPAGASVPDAAAPHRVVDSVFPMDVMLDRFRADLVRPAGLRTDITTRDRLVERVVDALAASDTAALASLAVDRAEFGYLYYPTAATARPPYELPPALAWFQLQEKNRRGVLRALRELGSHRIDYRGYRCDAAAAAEGENRIWSGCRVTLSRDGEKPASLALFGAIIERGGRFEILSFENDF